MAEKKPRIWRLSLNLDEFNAIASSFYSDDARALAFQGLSLGMNAGDLPSSAPEPFARAWAIGKAMRDEAEKHLLASSIGGTNSANSRKKNHGTAQPKGSKIEGGFEGGFEVPFEGGIEGGIEPNDKRQATSVKRENEETNNTPPKPPKGRVSFDPSEFDSMIPARIYSEESIEAWHQYAEHRRGKRAKLTELAVNLILKEFATATPKVFAEALRTSVANGWTGVFLGGSRPQAQQITMHPTANRPLRPDEMP